MAQGGDEGYLDLANLKVTEETAQENQISGRPPNPVEDVVETVQAALSVYSPYVPPTFIQGKQNQVFNTCTFNVSVSQGLSGISVEDEENKPDSRQDELPPSGLNKYEFGNFQRELCVTLGHYSRDVLLPLTKWLKFSSDETKAVLEPLNEWRFVRILREKGVISPIGIEQLTTAIENTFKEKSFDYRPPKFEMERLILEIKSSFYSPRFEPPWIRSQITHDEIIELEEMTEELVNGLKSQYEQRCYLRLILCRGDPWRSVNEVFVPPCIERLKRLCSPEHPKAWKRVSLYHEIVSFNSRSLRRVVHSDAGYGKSLLLQQFAHDWCESSPDSPLQYVTLFIWIRLREFQGVKSIYDAIGALLPAESTLTSSNIEAILTKGRVKITFAFDSFDEYIHANVDDNDITKIIRGKMFTSSNVVVTTRSSCLHNLQRIPTTQFRLFGFNSSMQESYLEKLMANDASPNDRQSIISRMQESDILRDLCQVPFFFALYVQFSLGNLIESRYDTVTGYFSHMIAQLFSHMEDKLKWKIPPTSYITEETVQHQLSLGKVAYDGLAQEAPRLIWSEEEMLHDLGSSCYELYEKTGVLLKECEEVFVSHPGMHLRDRITNRSSVSFLHSTVQEYYAAIYIAHMSKHISENDFLQVLTRIDCEIFHYVYRFTCGLDPLAATSVLRYLSGLGEEAEMYAILCVLEQGGDGIEDVIAQLCKKQIVFFFGESKLLQRSKINLLQIAAKRKIPIFSVCLFHSILTSRWPEVRKFDCLHFYTGLPFPVLDTLEMLMIDEIVPLVEIAENILNYATKCRALKSLIFNLALLPREITNMSILESLRKHGCDVNRMDFYSYIIIQE